MKVFASRLTAWTVPTCLVTSKRFKKDPQTTDSPNWNELLSLLPLRITPDLPPFFRKPKIRRLHPDEHSADEELPDFTATSAGSFSGLEVTLKLQQKDTDYLCRKGVTGFRVVLHPSVEMPQPSKHFFHVPLLQHVSVAVKPNIITTKSNVLYKYNEEAMRCVVDRQPHPRLKFFRNYTQRNCELECQSNFTSKLDLDYHFAVPSMFTFFF